jgi:potassium channel subfamily K protein
VPIYVSLLLMSGYILLGAFLFCLSEDWEPLVAAYFCFITLSTIGFGDYVPGTSLDSWRSQKTVVCALYLLCGLALIAMCFDLMQEEAKNKFRRLGRRLGLLSEDKSNT